MFTGIVEGIGKVKSVEKSGVSGKISVTAGMELASLRIGDSVAVNGACLTVIELSGDGFTADVSEESFRLTTLGELRAGDPVNLELSLTPTKPMGGHMVTGHVDGVGRLVKRGRSGACEVLSFSAPKELMRQTVKKGSIAVDGISLTVTDVSESGFSVAVIPHTLKSTTLGSKRDGDQVNIETDIIGKYVEKFLGVRGKGNVTEGFLAEHGFFNN